MRNVLIEKKSYFRFSFFELWSFLYSKSHQLSMNFYNNSKNIKWKIDFSFNSEHYASFIKTGEKLRGEVCISLFVKTPNNSTHGQFHLWKIPPQFFFLILIYTYPCTGAQLQKNIGGGRHPSLIWNSTKLYSVSFMGFTHRLLTLRTVNFHARVWTIVL